MAKLAKLSMSDSLGAVEAENFSLVGSRDLAAEDIQRQSDEGLVHVDEADDLGDSPGVPTGFPRVVTENGREVEIVPVWVNIDQFPGHRLKHYLTPITYTWTRSIPEMRYMGRSSFNAMGRLQNGDQVLCAMPRKTFDKYNYDNPGTCEITLRELNARAKVQRFGSKASTITDEVEEFGDRAGISGSLQTELKTVNELTHSQAVEAMRS